MRRLALVALCALVLVPAAGARPFFGVLGDSRRFESLTGQHTGRSHDCRLGSGRDLRSEVRTTVHDDGPDLERKPLEEIMVSV